VNNTPIFPSDFLWGVATAGHQNEGFNTASDTWFVEHLTPSVFREPSGAACDSWNRWREDLQLVTDMGLSAFRFSIEWARIEPQQGSFDERALAHYSEILEECSSRGLAAIVTFNHFSTPHWFAARGGWLHRESDSLFARYCSAVMEEFGDKISIAVTINEPNLPELLDEIGIPDVVRDLERASLAAASAAAGVPTYRLGNVVLPEEFVRMQEGLTRAHIAARRAIKQARPELPVGLSIAITDDVALLGGEPSRDQKRRVVYEHWLDLARADDFIGVQNYERMTYGPHGRVAAPSHTPRNSMGSAIEPLSLAGAVRYAHDTSGVPVLVTEHGLGSDDDTLRVDFIETALIALADVVRDGVPVLGYCHWTLLDNFEWVFGYGPKFGLHEVDRTTFARTAKASAHSYARFVAAQRFAAHTPSDAVE
jgi:beta-glucosidase